MSETDDATKSLPRNPRESLLLSSGHDDWDAAVALAGPMNAPVPRAQPGLYRVFWRWHFYAGLLVGPVLSVVAVTGAMYVFKHELERVIYADTMFVTPQAETVPLERQVAAVEQAFPGWRVDTIEIDTDPTRATSVRIRSSQSESQRIYVNQHSGAIQGSLGEGSVFRVILAVHRQLFIGTIGRVVVELATCWTIILLVTGLYLWFPRHRRKIWSAFVPRLWAKPYTVLRDLHAITGACVVPVALTMAGTGLIYSLACGTVYRYAAVSSEGGTATVVPKSLSSPGSPLLSLERAVAIVRTRYPGASFIDVRLPEKPNDALVARAKNSERSGPRNTAQLILDRSTGEVIAVKASDQLSALTWWRTSWNYPLHVGSVLGTPTKVLWMLACLGLAALPVTGMWMWWKRRPDGRTGFPRRAERRVPWWLIGAIGLLGALLPVVGASVLLILAGELVAGRLITTKVQR